MTNLLTAERPLTSVHPLAGRKAMVIGGSRGIGAAIVERLSRDGADVAFTYRGSAEASAALVARLEQDGDRRALALIADSADEQALSTAIADAAAGLGGLDILVYNAGILVLGSVEELDVSDLDRSYDVMVRGAFVAAQAAVRHMGEGGRIILIGSNVAERVLVPGATAYVAAKWAVAGMGRSLAVELAPRGITVNIVQPGPTATDMNPEDGPLAEQVRGLVPLGRFAETREVGALVSYLAGPEAGFITGARLNIDGGASV